MNLALELHQQIWEYALTFNSSVHPTVMPHGISIPPSDKLINVLLINKQALHEALTIFYAVNDFQVHSPSEDIIGVTRMSSFWSIPSKKNYHIIRNISIHLMLCTLIHVSRKKSSLADERPTSFVEFVQTLALDPIQLQSLTIRFRCEHDFQHLLTKDNFNASILHSEPLLTVALRRLLSKQ